METRLLYNLHHKLDDLESKIQAYRGDLITEFHRYYHDLIRDVGPGVVANIERAILPTFVSYPMLRPELEAADSRPPPPDSPKPATFQQTPTPVEASRIGSSESSREREIELQGLFTPSYLPLLDSSPPHGRPVISVATATATQTTTPSRLFPETTPPEMDSGSGKQTDSVMDDLSEPDGSTSPAALQPSVEAGSVVRTMTDDSTSSVCSDKSDSKGRRSALRRSSSLSKPPQSPRRVRFEFMGSEVLPTSSPRPSEFISPDSTPAPFLEDEPLNSTSIMGDDLEENLPPPRKSSSTEALRALSRAPAEEGTVWTVVNPDMEEIIPQPENRTTSTKRVAFDESASLAVTNAPMYQPGNSRPSYMSFQTAHDDSEQENDSDDEDSSEEEEFLAMHSKKSPTPKKYPPTPLAQSPTKQTNNENSTIADVMNSLSVSSNNDMARKEHIVSDEDAVDEYDDDMFHFEPGGLSAPPKPRQRPPPQQDESPDDGSQEDRTDDAQVNSGLYATSPAVSIARPPRTEPSTPTVSKFQPGSLGSYKGRPVIMPIVRDPDVHARAVSLGQFNTFVGGLDGRSGIDEGDLSSFRASVVQPNVGGTPRSFTERFMMEEAQAEREKTKGTAQSWR